MGPVCVKEDMKSSFSSFIHHGHRADAVSHLLMDDDEIETDTAVDTSEEGFLHMEDEADRALIEDEK